MAGIAVVCAAFDAASEREIAAVRALVRSLGAKAPRNPAHRPHLTLSAAAIKSPCSVLKVAREVAARHTPIRMRLSHVGTFGRGDVVYLAPTSTSPTLGALQRDAYESLIAAGYEPAFAGQSDPSDWRPHCTIARRMPPAILQQLQEQFQPVNVIIDAIATVQVGGSGDLGLAPLARKRTS